MKNSTATEQKPQTFIVHTHVDASVYSAFSTFNNFILNRRGLTLKLFPLLMTGMGIAHVASSYTVMGIAFIALGALLPLAYVGFHRRSLANQIKQYKLERPRLAYKVSLQQSGLFVENEKESTLYPYEMCYWAYRVPQYCYVYITKSKCFILPVKDLQDGVSEEMLWEFLQEKLGRWKTKSFIKKTK